jgi:hypothetical protein
MTAPVRGKDASRAPFTVGERFDQLEKKKGSSGSRVGDFER